MKIVLLLIFLKYFFIPEFLVSQEDSSKFFKDSVAIFDKHPQDFPPNSGFLIRAKDGDSYLRIKGSVRLNGAYDFNGLQSKSTFSTYDIPVGDDNSNEPRFFLSAYQSRLAIEIYKNTVIGNVFAKIEADFQGANNNLRLRLAYAVIENFLLGRAWSVFGDAEAVPKTVDKDGPNSSVTEKAVQIRFEPPAKNSWRYALALETPNPDITNPDTIEISPYFQSFPDITARIKFQPDEDKGHLQLASVFRSITIRDPDDELQVLAGYGGLLSGRFFLQKENTFCFQFVGGKGIASYIKSLTGEGLDAVYDPQENMFRLLQTYGGFVSFNRNWSKVISTQITPGLTYVVNLESQPAEAFKYSFYFSGNMFMNFSKIINIGIEYSYGVRVNKNDERGNANRISFISIVDF